MTVLLVVLAIIFYASFQIFSARAGGKIDGILVAGLVNLFGLIIPIGTYLIVRFAAKGEQLATTRSGLIMAALAGISISLFAMAFHKLFQGGTSLSTVSPVVFGAAIGLSVIYGATFLNESMNKFHIFGVILILTGLVSIFYARASV